MGKLRKASFKTFDEVVADIANLRDNGYEIGGRWNLSQVCQHFTATLRVGMIGGMKPMPWLMRATIGKLMTEYIVLTGRMPSGFQAPDLLIPPESPEDEPQKIATCLETLHAARDFNGPLRPHPFCLGLSLAKWKRLMLVHSGHHLSFLAPKAVQAAVG